MQYAGSYSFGRNVSKHRAVAEAALGKTLPDKAVVHHWDEDGLNNAPSNLLVCPDEAYHNLIHKRMRAYDACGNANFEKCQYCQTWAHPGSMDSVRKSDRPSTTFYHRACRQEWRLRARKEGKSV